LEGDHFPHDLICTQGMRTRVDPVRIMKGREESGKRGETKRFSTIKREGRLTINHCLKKRREPDGNFRWEEDVGEGGV